MKKSLAISLYAIVLVLFFVANIFYGSVDIPFQGVFSVLKGEECSEAWRVIVVETRLPQE